MDIYARLKFREVYVWSDSRNCYYSQKSNFYMKIFTSMLVFNTIRQDEFLGFSWTNIYRKNYTLVKISDFYSNKHGQKVNELLPKSYSGRVSSVKNNYPCLDLYKKQNLGCWFSPSITHFVNSGIFTLLYKENFCWISDSPKTTRVNCVQACSMLYICCCAYDQFRLTQSHIPDECVTWHSRLIII